MIKIGQIGIGHNHGEAKMQAVRKFPELFEVVGFAEDNEEWLKKRGNLECYKGLKRYSVDELIAKCDALLIETDVWDLTEIAQKCVDAGKHVHIDKPGSGTLEEYKKMLDTAKEKNLIVQLAYMYRYNPAIQKTFELIKEGKLGEIYSINAEMSTFHSPKYRKWLTNFGGGIMYILGCHLIDLIVYIMGKPDNIQSFLKKTKLDEVNVEDNNLAVLEYEKALARVFVSSVEVNGFGRRQFMVSGSKGTVNICPLERPITMTYSDTEIANTAYEDRKIILPFDDNTASGRYDEMIKDFYAYITGEKENPFTYEHEYNVQAVLDEVVGGVKFYGKDIG
ncbi:MAG: Gfo/Idh/MocA family oxidoreductase [Clostridia bacterium]|nr:Gfo/Idh/MocA family oxidoreductase [Clostridia bacterium]MBO5357930.1 Gfo/Idh/MocA family oxidoreductase [Clostridia bacterium]